MADSTGQVAFERKQMLKVRAALLDGFNRSEQKGLELTGFFEACAAYLVWAQQRVFVQDQTIHDLLEPRVPESEEEAHRLLGELKVGMDACRQVAATYKSEVGTLVQAGQLGELAFREATERYFEEAARAMPGGRNPLERWTNEHFAPQDWETIAHVSDDVVAEEKKLFQAVINASPEGIDPTSYEVFHPKAPS